MECRDFSIHGLNGGRTVESTSEEPRTLSATLAEIADRWSRIECAPMASSTKWQESANGRRVLAEVPDVVKEKCNPAALEMVRRAFSEHAWPVYLTGPTGTGKTSLAAYCFRGTIGHWAEQCQVDQQWPRWVVWPEFCAGLMSARINGMTIEHEDGRTYHADEKAWWRRWSTRRTVVVDEIGIRAASNVKIEAMWQLLECRRGLPTILTGNLGEKEIRNTFDDRILSRILQGTWIEIKGDDRRVTGHGSRHFVVGE